MDNRVIAQRLTSYAHHLEGDAGNVYRVKAYRRAAETILGLDRPVEEIVAARGRRGLEALPGIGSHLAFTIERLVRTGEFRTMIPDSVPPEERLDRLPLKWTADASEIGGRRYDPASHGLSLIYPNPLNPARYVVINSGHTFHARDFAASNAWLFPRLGDVAVQKFSRRDDGGYEEQVEWAALFDASWQLPHD